jgi:hypothetical protein
LECAARSHKEAQRRPDFVVRLGLHRLAAEIKQVDPNPSDLEQARRFHAGGIASFGGEPGARLRDHIKEASAQLRALTQCRWPGIAVLYDNTALSAYVDSYHIKAAMDGLEQLVFQSSAEYRPLSHFLGWRSGPKRRLTPSTGNAVSAVAHLRRGPDGTPHIDIYHNEHALAPLDATIWRTGQSRHFKLPAAGRMDRREWIEI